MKVRTSFIYPPIPIRRFDWCAVDDETYEGGCPIGFGATETEAVADLLEQPVTPPIPAGAAREGA